MNDTKDKPTKEQIAALRLCSRFGKLCYELRPVLELLPREELQCILNNMDMLQDYVNTVMYSKRKA